MLTREGRPLVIGLAVLAALLETVAYLARWWPGYLSGLAPLGLALFLGAFFRDPERVGRGDVLSAADGHVLVVNEEGPRVRIGTFMNVTDVHVNRFPVSGYLLRVEDRGGPRRPAFSPQASGNAQKRYLMVCPLGVVEVVQITGLLARRCRSWREPGTAARRGDRLGMILFGSRVDVVLPRDRVRVLVRPGDRVRAGSTALAEVVP